MRLTRSQIPEKYRWPIVGLVGFALAVGILLARDCWINRAPLKAFEVEVDYTEASGASGSRFAFRLNNRGFGGEGYEIGVLFLNHPQSAKGARDSGLGLAMVGAPPLVGRSSDWSIGLPPTANTPWKLEVCLMKKRRFMARLLKAIPSLGRHVPASLHYSKRVLWKSPIPLIQNATEE